MNPAPCQLRFLCLFAATLSDEAIQESKDKGAKNAAIAHKETEHLNWRWLSLCKFKCFFLPLKVDKEWQGRPHRIYIYRLKFVIHIVYRSRWFRFTWWVPRPTSLHWTFVIQRIAIISITNQPLRNQHSASSKFDCRCWDACGTCFWWMELRPIAARISWQIPHLVCLGALPVILDSHCQAVFRVSLSLLHPQNIHQQSPADVFCKAWLGGMEENWFFQHV